MKSGYIWFFAAVLTIPFLWGINVWQANTCGEIRNEIKKIEIRQENYVRENKTIAHEIGNLLAIDRLEDEARKQGMSKMPPENVLVIMMKGEGRGH